MKRSTDQAELSQFERDVKSLRQQCLESDLEEMMKGLKKNSPKEDVEDARRVYNLACFRQSVVRNKVDPIYPSENDGGEVVAMGTEEANALGLLKDVEEDKLYEYEPTLIPKSKLDMQGGKTVVSVAAGGLHSACLHRDGTVSTWGANDENALGRGKVDEDDLHLIKPMNIKDAVQISAGDNHTLILDIHGKVHASGLYKDVDSGLFRDLLKPGDLAFKVKDRDGPQVDGHDQPVEVVGLGNNKIMNIDAGNSWNAALSEDGSLYTWGMGCSGQLARSKGMGAGLIEDEYFDSKGKNPRPYKTYELKKPFMGTQTDAKGYVYDVEKIRDTFMTPALVEWAGGPTQKRKVMNFSCGDIHLLVVTWDPASYQTQVFSSGNGAYGQLGHGNTKEIHELTPVEALNNKHISKVAAGNFHSLALTMNGRALYSWGKVDQGCLGLYDETKTLKHAQIDFVGTPQQVPFPTDLGNSFLVDIAAGDVTSFAITDTGAVYSWGYNENSQTGHYNVPDTKDGKADEHGNIPTSIVARPRLLDVIGAVNDGLKKAKETVVAKNCRVTRVSGGGQHSLMVIKRYQ